MKELFKIQKEGEILVIENPRYPHVRAELDSNRIYTGIRKVNVMGVCKISEIKKTLKEMEFFLENHKEELQGA